jgi:hypothetical protein
MHRFALASTLLLLAAPGCGPGPGPSPDGGVRTCTLDLDCDDGIPCTLEACGVGGVCEYTPLDTRCGAGESCIVGRGCVSGMTCASAAECDDAIACTIDTCGVGGICRHMALDELCTDPALPSCDATMGCVRGSGCMGAADCDDGVACTIDSCSASRMCTHTAMDALCDPGETCNPATGCFASMDCTTPADCDDGNFCNGTERCDTKFGCMPGTPPACNDSDTCTVDACDSTLGMCTFTCDRSMAACTSRPGCEAPPVSCTGTFSIVPSAPPICPAGARPNFSMTTFAYDGVVLTITDRAAGFPDLTDAIEPACPNFEATVTVEGGCREIYTMTGTFSDDNTFDGEFVADYVNVDGISCALGGCRGPYITPINGMRL